MSPSKKKNSSCSISLEDTYNLACEKHEIEESKFQRGLIREFEKVSNNLLSRKRNSFLSLLKNFFFRSIGRPTAKVQKGIYIWGSVCVCKTFMMDLFYDFLPIEGKERYHFHEFMIMVHKILKKNMNQQTPLRQVTRVVLKNTNIYEPFEYENFLLKLGFNLSNEYIPGIAPRKYIENTHYCFSIL